uniref:Integrin_alpha2 domain-containing protein n=1 Tax=Steinernema glaseri TaxID=37863 RepID=A0A1I7YJJ2_9BILA
MFLVVGSVDKVFSQFVNIYVLQVEPFQPKPNGFRRLNAYFRSDHPRRARLVSNTNVPPQIVMMPANPKLVPSTEAALLVLALVIGLLLLLHCWVFCAALRQERKIHLSVPPEEGERKRSWEVNSVMDAPLLV